MIISARLIEKPRDGVVHRCCECDKRIIGRKLRLFGYAETGDQPYVLYAHPSCNLDGDPKIRAALARGAKLAP